MWTIRAGSGLLLCCLLAIAADPRSEASAGDGLIPSDRRIDWALAGIPGGIPVRSTVCVTLDAAAYGDGRADATTAIQAALDACPAGQVVLLPPGIYRTTDTIHLWTDKTLRGAGPGRTVLRYDGGGTRSVLDLRGSIYNDIYNVRRIYAIPNGARKDARQLTLASTAGIAVGDVLLVDQLNDGRLVDNVGSEGACTYCSRENGTRPRGQFAEVTAVQGATVTLNLPLFFDLDPALMPEAVLVSARSMIRRAGVEDLSLTQAQPVNDFIIEMDGAQYSWLRNVEVTGMKRRGLWHIDSLQNEIRDSSFHDAVAGFGRDRGYGLQLDLQSTANLVENNLFYVLDGGGIMTSGGAVGNVLGYNYLPDIRFDDPWWLIGGPSMNHSAHPSMNLWEGNIGPQISGDFIHGSSSHQTFFRSQSLGWKEATATANNNAIDFQHKNTFMSVLGCVLGTPGQSDTYEAAFPAPASSELKAIWRLGYGGPNGAGDPNVKTTLLRHGNWDSVSNATVWDPAIANHQLPASLYKTAKPAWWGNLPWPPIGPDLTPMVGKIPAQLRYERAMRPGVGAAMYLPFAAASAPVPIDSVTSGLAHPKVRKGLTK
jgi:hypothetical protein